MPMTLLEKQWLKAVTLDPRIKLFDISIGGLDDIEPLFTPDDYVIYDKYSDGDPFEDERYIGNFRTILRAIHEKQPIKIETVNRKGQVIQMNVMPGRLEYSEKDDKFRLISSGCRYGGTVNLARIVSCKRYYGDALSCTAEKSVHYRSVALRISDERNALERCMLHFANFEKQAERVDNRHYILRIKYDRDDETEILIRILGFGPMVEVLEPESFINIIKERLKKQKSCGLP